jgi:hypothetical protein
MLNIPIHTCAYKKSLPIKIDVKKDEGLLNKKVFETIM